MLPPESLPEYRSAISAAARLPGLLPRPRTSAVRFLVRRHRRRHGRPEARPRGVGPGVGAGKGRQTGRGRGYRRAPRRPVGQRDAVAGYLKTLHQDLDTAKADIDQLLKNNQAMAGQMAKLQGEAARWIDERTRAPWRNPAREAPERGGHSRLRLLSWRAAAGSFASCPRTSSSRSSPSTPRLDRRSLLAGDCG